MQWHKKFDVFNHWIEFSRTEVDHCCYSKRYENEYTILLLYVDDKFIVGNIAREVGKLKKQLSERFAMKYLGDAKQILGMRIDRDKLVGKLYLSHTKYNKKVLRKFSM